MLLLPPPDSIMDARQRYSALDAHFTHCSQTPVALQDRNDHGNIPLLSPQQLLDSSAATTATTEAGKLGSLHRSRLISAHRLPPAFPPPGPPTSPSGPLSRSCADSGNSSKENN
ncbi:Hypothetical predicted protein [Marmota monax]|uniref:Uncharacterized protein n=1 Tax=Marmota monax TaxID=9995 RepID=A0A5E4D0M0_MARMO|nr:Hypothetical predicted protein [Marmota monax]